MRLVGVWLCSVAYCVFMSTPGWATPDAGGWGPLGYNSFEYRLPSRVIDDVLDDRVTEIWARVYHPVPFPRLKHPLLIFLHGNHATCGVGENPRLDISCQYSETGQCGPGEVVVPNHVGYAYLAEPLATWGYVVVSINANRGINCSMGVSGDTGLNLARGRLVLKHLEYLSQWNQEGPGLPLPGGQFHFDHLKLSPLYPLSGRLDFDQVGFMGHSRGGEGVRAAYHLYRESESPWPAKILEAVNVRGIFEIGAVDGQTAITLNAEDVVWNQTLPMCDGDVYDLQGVKPYDRMLMAQDELLPNPKSYLSVWGANHNFFNTEWQVSESGGCADHTPLFPPQNGSPEQEAIGRSAVMAFFRANVGVNANPIFNQTFNPEYELPLEISEITRVERGYSPSSDETVSISFEDFQKPPGFNSSGAMNDSNQISIDHSNVPRHELDLMGAHIEWVMGGSSTYFQSNYRHPGLFVQGFDVLSFRVSRQDSPLNTSLPTEFSIRLEDASGNISSYVPLSSYLDLIGPVGTFNGGNNYHPILQTVRIPLSHFFGVNLNELRGVRFTFESGSGAIYLSDIRFTNFAAGLSLALGNGPVPPSVSRGDGTGHETASQVNELIDVRFVEHSRSLKGRPGIEIELRSDQVFPVGGALPTLTIGGEKVVLSHYPRASDLRSLVFTLSLKQFSRIKRGDPMEVRVGPREWDFGEFN